MILVVGATGQLGSLVVRTLREQDQPVRAMVRDPSAADDLTATGAEVGEHWDTAELTDRLGVHDLLTVVQVLREKAALERVA